MKKLLKVLLYGGLSLFCLLLLTVGVAWVWLRWAYHLPNDQTARSHFLTHRAEYVRFASLLRQDPGPKMIEVGGGVDANTKNAREVPEYGALMDKIGAKSVQVLEDGSIEFQSWGFGCAPCHDSFMGIRYQPVVDGARPREVGWEAHMVSSLDDAALPKTGRAISDGLYVIPVDREWSIYRLEISD